jgi:hypothetical protein
MQSFLSTRARTCFCAFAGIVLATAGCKDGTGPGESVASVTVTGAPTGPLLSGGTVQLVANPINATGAAISGAKVSWTSGDTLVAKVSAQGLVSAVGAGPVSITASVGDKRGAATLDVRAGGVVGPDGGTLNMMGGAVTLAVPAEALGQATTILLRPAPSAPAHARLVAGTAFELGPEGPRYGRLATLAVRYDAARIPAGVDPTSLQLYTLSSGAWVVVRGSRANTGERTVTGSITGPGTYAVIGTGADQVIIRGSAAGGALYTGQTGELRVVVLDVNRDTLQGRVATWTSSDAARASVDASGKVTALSAGTVTITATVDGKAATTEIVILAKPAASWNETADWSTFQGDPAHRGDIDATLDPTVFRALWTVPLVSGALHQVATGDGKVFASTVSYFGTQRLWALDAATGAQRWMRDFGDINSVHPPAFGNGRVYIQTGGHQDSFLWSLDAGDGTLRFRTAYGNQWSSWLAPVVADSGVYAAGGYYGGMSRFNAITGASSYFMNRPQEDQWTPAVHGGLVFSYSGSGLTASGARSGAMVYEIVATGLPRAGTPVVSAANRVLGTNGNSLFAIDLEGRKLAWMQSASMTGTPAVAEGVVYVINKGQVDARQESDGTLLWSWVPPEGQARNTMIVTRNLLFVSTSANTYAVDLAARRHTWSYAAAGQLSMSKEGLLLIAQPDGKLSAISVR